MPPQLAPPIKLPVLLSLRVLPATEIGLAPLLELAKGTARESFRGKLGLTSMLFVRVVLLGRGEAPVPACCRAEVRFEVRLWGELEPKRLDGEAISIGED